MLLHLGKDIVIPLRDIIAIIDKKSAFESDHTKKFFEEAENKGEIENITKDIKTYVLADKVKGRNKTKEFVIYTSNISSNTLKKRAGFVDDIINL